MRVDGRAAGQVRPVRMEVGYTAYAEGSVLISQGGTVVLCNASIEEGRLPAWLAAAETPRGWVTAEYSMLPRSTQSRTPRETTPQARTQEIRRLVGRSLRAAVDLSQLGPRLVTVDCDVLQADGGTRTASITGGYVALVLALRRLIDAGRVPPSVLLAPVAAVSVGVVDGESLLDLCYAEDVHAEVDLNIVMNREGRYIEVQGTAEHRPFDRTTLDRLLDLAAGGIGQMLQAQEAALSRP